MSLSVCPSVNPIFGAGAVGSTNGAKSDNDNKNNNNDNNDNNKNENTNSGDNSGTSIADTSIDENRNDVDDGNSGKVRNKIAEYDTNSSSCTHLDKSANDFVNSFLPKNKFVDNKNRNNVHEILRIDNERRMEIEEMEKRLFGGKSDFRTVNNDNDNNIYDGNQNTYKVNNGENNINFRKNGNGKNNSNNCNNNEDSRVGDIDRCESIKSAEMLRLLSTAAVGLHWVEKVREYHISVPCSMILIEFTILKVNRVGVVTFSK